MPNIFGTESKANLEGVHEQLQRLHEKVLEIIDHAIVDGVRTPEEQAQNLAKGVSRTPNSLHLLQPDGKSHATDCIPYPNNWDEVEKGLNALKKADPKMYLARFYYLNGIIRGVAHCLEIPIRQGVDWDGDTDLGDQSFIDLGHTELKKG